MHYKNRSHKKPLFKIGVLRGKCLSQPALLLCNHRKNPAEAWHLYSSLSVICIFFYLLPAPTALRFETSAQHCSEVAKENSFYWKEIYMNGEREEDIFCLFGRYFLNVTTTKTSVFICSKYLRGPQRTNTDTSFISHSSQSLTNNTLTIRGEEAGRSESTLKHPEYLPVSFTRSPSTAKPHDTKLLFLHKTNHLLWAKNVCPETMRHVKLLILHRESSKFAKLWIKWDCVIGQKKEKFAVTWSFLGSNPVPCWETGNPFSSTTILTVSGNVSSGLDWGGGGGWFSKGTNQSLWLYPLFKW